MPPRPTWSSGTVPPGGGGGGGLGNGGSSPRPPQELTPEQKKILEAKKGENIIADEEVIKIINKKWNDAMAIGRVELGFYIFYHPDTEEYYVGDIFVGEINPPTDESASIEVGPPVPTADMPDGVIPVAFYHNHTPVLEPGYERQTGSHQGDMDAIEGTGLTGIIKDFIGTYDEKTGQYKTEYNDTTGTKIYFY